MSPARRTKTKATTTSRPPGNVAARDKLSKTLCYRRDSTRRRVGTALLPARSRRSGGDLFDFFLGTKNYVGDDKINVGMVCLPINTQGPRLGYLAKTIVKKMQTHALSLGIVVDGFKDVSHGYPIPSKITANTPNQTARTKNRVDRATYRGAPDLRLIAANPAQICGWRCPSWPLICVGNSFKMSSNALR